MVKKMPVDRHKIGRYSKSKGKRGERMWAKVCREHGFKDARRTQQFSGGTQDSSDVVGLDGIHIEVKFVEKLNLRNAMAQSEEDAKNSGKGEIPIVAHKTSNKPWLVTMLTDDWFELYEAWLKAKEKDNADK